MSTTMVKLKQVEKDGDAITCVALVEDCAEPIRVVMNVADGTFQHSPLPKGYEYCASHIGHARRALERMVKDGKIVSETTVMWY